MDRLFFCTRTSAHSACLGGARAPARSSTQAWTTPFPTHASLIKLVDCLSLGVATTGGSDDDGQPTVQSTLELPDDVR
jgi:hypothetical protein